MRPPLIYVKQSNLSAPKRHMQSEYHSPSADETVQPEQQSIRSKKSIAFIKRDQLINHKSVNPSTHTFEQMTIDEKIDSLISPSKYLPNMNCKVSIGETHYRGRILERLESKIIFIESQTRRKHHFVIDQIETIDIIGF